MQARGDARWGSAAARNDAETDEGWSVNAVGPARVVHDPAEVDALHDRAFTPWAREQDVVYVAIRPAVLRGRRLTTIRLPR